MQDKDFTTQKKYEEELKSKLVFEQKWTDRLAGRITEASGSMWFLTVNAVFFLIWIIWNFGLIPGFKIFDPFPFGLLTMIVSLLAIFLAVIVLISQNRQGRMADIRQQIDFEINVRAEDEITKMLVMLEGIQSKLGIVTTKDKQLEDMKQNIDIEEIQQKIEEIETREEEAKQL
jgi:uncharacterized membrane protein